MDSLDDLLALRLGVGGGVATIDQIRACGLDDHEAARLVRRGRLRRVRAGVFVDAELWAASGAADRHRLEASAIGLVLGTRHVLSHLTAVVWWGLPVLAVDLGRIHLSLRRPGRPRADDRIQIHSLVPAEQVREHEGRHVVAPALAVLQTAACSGVRAGLVAADAALARQLVTPETLAATFAVVWLGPGRRRAARVVELARPTSESPGESWARLVFAELGLDEPRQQAVIRDERGHVVARVDFLFEGISGVSGVVVEFDGLVKYDGSDGRAALVAEKRREDELRRLGYRVVRLTWADLADARRLARILLPALGRPA